MLFETGKEIKPFEIDIDKYDKDQADKLLQNINIIGDLPKLQVPDPESNKMKLIPLSRWVSWLIKRVETYGEFGIEGRFIQIIEIIDKNMWLMRDRMKEGFRRLINVIERQEIEIKILKNELEEKKQPQEIVTNEVNYEHSYDVSERGTGQPEDEKGEKEQEIINNKTENDKNEKENELASVQKPQKSDIKPDRKRGFGRI